MAHIHLDKHDGPIRLQLDDHDVIIEGVAAVSYKSRRSSGLPHPRRSKFLAALNTVARVATIVSAIGALMFLIWQWSAGADTPQAVSLSAKVFSIALVGSLLSFGGVNLLSLKGELSAVQESIAPRDQCPFLFIVAESSDELRRPGNPRFCVKCPLGIDTSSNVDGGLIHTCKVYAELHREWIELPSARRFMEREFNA